MSTISLKILAGVVTLAVVGFGAANVTGRFPRMEAESAPADRITFKATAAALPAAAPPAFVDAPAHQTMDRFAAAGVAGVGRQSAQAPPASIGAFWASRKLIRSGDLRILVKDVRRAIAAADSIGRSHGALLADSRASGDAQTTQQAELQFRVPAARFSEIVAALRTLGDVRNESITSADVTKDYADLETRLRVKDETVTRLRSLLATHTAKLGDVLQVEQELARTVTELEQLKGERQYYDQQVAMSTLSIALFEQQVVPPKARFTDPVVVASRHALEVLGTSLAGIVYGIVFIGPWLILATIFWWVFTLLRPRLTLPAIPRGPSQS
jgi:hypothetical protein